VFSIVFDRRYRQLFCLILASSFLHYQFDSFLAWKAWSKSSQIFRMLYLVDSPIGAAVAMV
jgi:hypothetical protein